MRIDDFIREREALVSQIKELCSLRDHVFNSRKRMTIDERPVMVQFWYSPSDSIYSMIRDEISGKIDEARAKLSSLEARVSIKDS